MSEPLNYFYLTGSADDAFVLRKVTFDAISRTQTDVYVATLGSDTDLAHERGTELSGDLPMYHEGAKLPRVEEHATKSWQRRSLDIIEDGYTPFGKHKGLKIDALDEGYIKYWLVRSEISGPVATTLLSVMMKIANSRGYFSKWDKEDKAIADQAKNMKHVGEHGERLEMFLKCERVTAFEGQYGLTFMNICKNRAGDELVYRGGKKWNVGDYYRVKATIAKHTEYKGKPQTFVSRPHIIAVIEGKKET